MSTAQDYMAAWKAEQVAKRAQFKIVRVNTHVTYWVKSGGVEYKIVHDLAAAEGHWNQYQIGNYRRGSWSTLDNEGATYKRVLGRLKAALATTNGATP